jgi:hypothetical protein
MEYSVPGEAKSRITAEYEYSISAKLSMGWPCMTRVWAWDDWRTMPELSTAPMFASTGDLYLGQRDLFRSVEHSDLGPSLPEWIHQISAIFPKRARSPGILYVPQAVRWLRHN